MEFAELPGRTEALDALHGRYEKLARHRHRTRLSHSIQARTSPWSSIRASPADFPVRWKNQSGLCRFRDTDSGPFPRSALQSETEC